MTASPRKTALDRKGEIEQAALALAFLVGPDLVTTTMIAKRLNITQPAIYKHFSSKNAIWTAVAGQLAAQITENAKSADKPNKPGSTPRDRIIRLVMGQLRLIELYPALPELMIARDAQENLRRGRQQLQPAMAAFRKALTREVAAAVEQGGFGAGLVPGDGAALILGVIQSLVLQMLIKRDPTMLRVDGERLLELLLSGFESKGEHK